jgi:1-acyl-sn-glycerol-3-phosphate acyltransferase
LGGPWEKVFVAEVLRQGSAPRLRESIDTRVRTAVGLLVVPAALMLYSSVVIALALLGASQERIQRVYVGFARLWLRVAGTQLEIHGEEHVRPGQAYVVVLNHESAIDPACLTAALPPLFLRFVAKVETMNIPILGHALRRTGNVTVVRTDTAGDVQRLREAMGRREPGVSLLFCAEGTRSLDGALHAFKMGAFATALGYGLPILPTAIAGSYAIWPKKTLRLRRGPVAIEIGEPIAVDGFRFEDRAILRERTHEAVATLRATARQRLRDRGHDPGGID